MDKNSLTKIKGFEFISAAHLSKIAANILGGPSFAICSKPARPDNENSNVSDELSCSDKPLREPRRIEEEIICYGQLN